MPNNSVLSGYLEALSAREVPLLRQIQGALYHRPGVLPAARGLSHLGEHAAGWLALSAAAAAVDKPRRRSWLQVAAATFGAHAASVIIKRIIRRPRPHHPSVAIGVSTPSQLSFPSSHATSTTAFLVGSSRVLGNNVPLLGVPVMMASRMVLGVHYPTDTAVGAALGAAMSRALVSGEKDNS